MKSNSKMPLVSFFSGAGGLDLGFHQVGFETIFAVDKDLSAVQTFNKNFKNKISNQLDLSTIDTELILHKIEQTGIHPIGAIGGPPCQGFSIANTLSRSNDPRNLLPFKYAEIITALVRRYNIDFFVFENVPGIRYKKHTDVFTRIKIQLANAGFQIFEEIIDAANFGIPQIRKRLFFVGINVAKYPQAKFSFPKGMINTLTVFDAIGHLPEPTFFNHKLTASQIPYHGNHWTMRPRSKKFTEGIKPGGRSFRMLSWDKKSPTVAYGNREIHVHPNGKRRLSIFEAMLLQGFPLSYKIEGNLSKQVEQISNAVPPPVAKAIAKSIKISITSSNISGEKND